MPRIKATDLPSEFTALSEVRKAHNEHRDCTVVALTIVTGLSYATCHKALADAGRQSRKGAWQDVQKRAVEALGFTWREWSFKERMAMIESYPGAHKNLATITTHHPRRFAKAWAPHRDKTLLLYSRGHVSAMKGGIVMDWAINRSKQVYMVVEITKS